MSLVLDEQLRNSYSSLHSLVHASMKCFQDLGTHTDDDQHLHSLVTPSSIQISSNSPVEDIQRQVSQLVSQHNHSLARYHTALQQQQQRSTQINHEIREKESKLANLQSHLETHGNQLQRHTQELLQVTLLNHRIERGFDFISKRTCFFRGIELLTNRCCRHVDCVITLALDSIF